MKIELLGWKSEGLRSPDIEIGLARADGTLPPITLIQMPNGTGKTTTLSCLRAAMDGSAETWTPEKVSEFRRIEDSAATGSFLARLLVNGKQRITIEMTFHFEEGAVTYRTLVGSCTYETYAPPPEVLRYLDPKFSELLFFDGETASSLLDKNSGANASKIIDTFYGLYHLSDLKEDARKDYAARESRSGVGKGAADAAKQAKRRDRMIDKAGSLRKLASEKQVRMDFLREARQRVDSELEAHLLKSEQFQEDEARAREEKETASGLLQKGFHELDKVFPDPWAIWPPLVDRVNDLVGHLDHAKLIEQPPRQYLEELAHSELCVCDRPMDHEAREAVKGKAALVLDDAVTGFLQSLKRDVVAKEGQRSQRFDAAVAEIHRADNLLTSAQEALKNIRVRAEESGDEEAARKKAELQTIGDEIDKLEQWLAEARRPTRRGDDESSDCIDFFAKEAAKAEDKLATLSGTLEWKRRTDTLIEVIDEAYREAHETLKKEVVVRANDRLAQILRYNPVQIKDIGAAVVLDGRGGASVGQTLAVGYVFLAGLLHEGDNQFPLVVDSPVGSLDDEARKELGGLLPILTKQMVCFVIASERRWFVDKLEETSEDEIYFLTHLRINEYTKEVIAGLKGDRLNETVTGVLIGGREAFMALGEDVDEKQ